MALYKRTCFQCQNTNIVLVLCGIVRRNHVLPKCMLRLYSINSSYASPFLFLIVFIVLVVPVVHVNALRITACVDCS